MYYIYIYTHTHTHTTWRQIKNYSETNRIKIGLIYVVTLAARQWIALLHAIRLSPTKTARLREVSINVYWCLNSSSSFDWSKGSLCERNDYMYEYDKGKQRQTSYLQTYHIIIRNIFSKGISASTIHLHNSENNTRQVSFVSTSSTAMQASGRYFDSESNVAAYEQPATSTSSNVIGIESIHTMRKRGSVITLRLFATITYMQGI